MAADFDNRPMRRKARDAGNATLRSADSVRLGSVQSEPKERSSTIGTRPEGVQMERGDVRNVGIRRRPPT